MNNSSDNRCACVPDIDVNAFVDLILSTICGSFWLEGGLLKNYVEEVSHSYFNVCFHYAFPQQIFIMFLVWVRHYIGTRK